MQRFIDNVLAITKESVKTFTYESLNNVARLVNGVSALLLVVLPGKTTILEGIYGWELRPTFRGPKLPRWMENGVSSFNQLIHELSEDSGTSSSEDYTSAEEDDDENTSLPAPLPQSSCLSPASSFTKKLGADSSSLEEHQSSHLQPSNKSNLIKYQMVHRTTDRRRGVFEDLQLSIEIFIEAVFDTVHKGAHYLLSPSETCHMLYRWFFSHISKKKRGRDADVPVLTSTLGDADPSPNERQTPLHQSLNTDARTFQDVITEFGYPYEAIRVVTSDGYVLHLERLPRHDSKKVVYLQHGILDSSMWISYFEYHQLMMKINNLKGRNMDGDTLEISQKESWVYKGVVGSPAFAAFDQGYDVFLGNLRGLVSREHVDKDISSRKYWNYSINEHATQDMPAVIDKIHEIKTSELKSSHPELDHEIDEQPYKLCAVCHSLGGAVMLMYMIIRRIEGKPHRLSRLILLSPAGFHEDGTLACKLVKYIVLMMAPILACIVPALYIPTRFFRMLLNKLARDFQNYPALGGLVQTLMSYVVGGDSSNWVGAIASPHYNMNNMPGISFHVAHHLVQMMHAQKFIMYDFGSAAANMEAYGSPNPLDVGQHYGLIDVPVDLVAGLKDRVIPPSMVQKHYKLMKNEGVEASYNEYEYAHLDFTFSHREELLAYVTSRLLLVAPPLKPSINVQTVVKSKKTDAKGLAKVSSNTLSLPLSGDDTKSVETNEITAHLL